MILHAFEPGSVAVALYLLHSQIPHIQRRRRPLISCNRIKIFLRKNKKDIRELTIDEITDPTLDLINYHTRHIHDVLHNFPLSSPYILSLYFLIMVLVVLI